MNKFDILKLLVNDQGMLGKLDDLEAFLLNAYERLDAISGELKSIIQRFQKKGISVSLHYVFENEGGIAKCLAWKKNTHKKKWVLHYEAYDSTGVVWDLLKSGPIFEQPAYIRIKLENELCHFSSIIQSLDNPLGFFTKNGESIDLVIVCSPNIKIDNELSVKIDNKVYYVNPYPENQ